MKKYVIILFFVIGFCGFIKANDILSKAELAYDNRNYKESISLYQQLVNDGNKSFELYFNLGNSYYRNKELGKAIYYYELARKLNPNDKDVQINLGIAATKTVDKIDAKENFFINAVKSNIVNSLTTQYWAWLSIVLAFLFSILLFVFISIDTIIVKRITFSLSIISFIALIVVYGFGNSAVNSKKENKFAIVLTNEVKITNEPNESAYSKFSLHEGTKVRIVEVNNDWVLIKIDNGNEGWLKQSDVGII